MKRMASPASILALFVILAAVSLLRADIFSQRITGTLYERAYNYPESLVRINVSYTYSATDPPLVSSISSTTTTFAGGDSTSTTTLSTFEGGVQYINGLTKIEYYEYRAGYPTHYAYLMFLFNEEDDLLEMKMAKPGADSLHAVYHYRADNQPDSLYYKKSEYPYPSWYSFYYDENDCLDYCLQYIPYDGQWNLYRRFNQTYAYEAPQYPAPLDFNNYRFYNVSSSWNGAFEECSPIYDKAFAPTSIAHEQWDDYYQSWFPASSSFYGAQTDGGLVTLVEGQYGSYTGHYHFDETGTYIGKETYYADGTMSVYHVYWDPPHMVGADDPAQTPAPSRLNCHPNPFRDRLTIRLDQKTDKPVTVAIYNIRGQLVKQWVSAGGTELAWDGRDAGNRFCNSGIYLVKLTLQGMPASTKRVTLVR